MAAGRALAADWSLLCSVRACFKCCYDGGGDRRESRNSYGTADDPPADKEGSREISRSRYSLESWHSGGGRRDTKRVRRGRPSSGVTDDAEPPGDASSLHNGHADAEDRLGGQRTGGAYAYDDQDTSSDSDDEVLRRYQQTMARSQSTQSYTQLSQRSAVTGSLTAVGERPAGQCGPSADKLLTPGGDKHDVSSSAGYSSAGEDGSEAAPPAAPPASVSLPAAVSPPGEAAQNQAEPAAQKTYENDAYQADRDTISSMDRVASPLSTNSTSLDDPAHEDHLFDVSDLHDRAESAIISKCGSLEVTFSYDAAHTRMSVRVHRARDIPSKERGGASSTQVRLLLLPAKRSRMKTRIRCGDQPEYDEVFSFKVPLEEACKMGVRFRLYGCERMRRERMIGECVIGFASFGLEHDITMWLALEPRSNLGGGDSRLDIASLAHSDSASSTQSMQHGGMPELLIGLGYNGTTGRLAAEIIKGSNFRNMAMNRAPDTYVKLTLMSPNGQEMTRSKTSIRRGQPNPLYKETFMFQVALFQLPDVTLMVSVYNKRSMKRKEMIGWFALGYNNSGEEELSHWDDMRESKGEPVCRWHVLLEA